MARSSVRMTDEEIWSFVTDAHTGVLTTLRADGMPVALPVWFACLERTIYVNTRGKKVARIRRDPRASFLVEVGERWADLRAVHLTGVADVPDLGASLTGRIVGELARKYARFRSPLTAEQQAYYAGAGMTIVRLRPDARVLNWDNRRVAGSG